MQIQRSETIRKHFAYTTASLLLLYDPWICASSSFLFIERRAACSNASSSTHDAYALIAACGDCSQNVDIMRNCEHEPRTHAIS